jgi:hypothetical protein
MSPLVKTIRQDGRIWTGPLMRFWLSTLIFTGRKLIAFGGSLVSLGVSLITRGQSND